MTMRILGLPLRGLEFLFSLLVMALIGNVIAMAFSGNPATVNYAIFASVFGMVSLFYLIPATISDDYALHPLIPIVLDALNAIFFLTAGIALAARLEAHSCKNHSYLAHNEITNGSLHHQEKRCREAQAATAFLWFAWAAFMGSLLLSLINARSSSSTRASSRPAVRRPGMSQV